MRNSRIVAACIVVAFAGLGASARADVYSFTVNSQASSLHDSVNVSAPLTGTLIGSYDATSNPTGTQTRPGLFGGSGNNAIPTTGSVAAVDDSTTHPSGGFTMNINAARGIASISGLHIDYLSGQHPDIVLNLGVQYATFHTVAPAAIFPGGIAVTFPIQNLARFDTLSVEQAAVPAAGQLQPTGIAGQYRFATLVPARVTVAGTVMGNPIPISQPVPVLLPVSATITIGAGGSATAAWSFDSSFEHVITGPVYTIQNQALDVPTFVPPGGTAHLVLNGELGDLSISLASSGAIEAAGQLQSPSCPADFNGDGHVNLLDFLAFVNAYAAGDPRADFNGDGRRNVLDFITFLNAYGIGC